MSVHEWLLRLCIACDDLLEERERGGGSGSPCTGNFKLIRFTIQVKLPKICRFESPPPPSLQKNYLSDPNESNPPRKKTVMAPYVHSPFRYEKYSRLLLIVEINCWILIKCCVYLKKTKLYMNYILNPFDLLYLPGENEYLHCHGKRRS